MDRLTILSLFLLYSLSFRWLTPKKVLEIGTVKLTLLKLTQI